MIDARAYRNRLAPPPGALPSPRLIAFDPAVQFNRSYPPCCRTADKILFVGLKREYGVKVGTLNSFDTQLAETQFEQRIRSLEEDTKRCFWTIPGGPGEAYFPAVLYAFATIDYFSSYWAGWNDSGGDRNKKQTVRLVDFIKKYLGYQEKESKIAVNIWRHKLMHTGEPRVLTTKNSTERYHWGIGVNLPSHMVLTQVTAPNEYELQFDCYAIGRDLRAGVLGASGYLTDLRNNTNLQRKFVDCFNEMETYTIDL